MELSEALAELREARARGDLTARELRREQRRLTDHFIALKAGRVSRDTPAPRGPAPRQPSTEAELPAAAGPSHATLNTSGPSASGNRSSARLLLVAVVVAALVGALTSALVLRSADSEDATADGAGQSSDDGDGYGGDGVDMSQPDRYEASLEEAPAAARQAPAAITYVFVPDVTGIDPNSAYDALEAAGLRMSNGRVGAYGFVSSQSPRAGARVPAGTSVLVGVTYG